MFCRANWTADAAGAAAAGAGRRAAAAYDSYEGYVNLADVAGVSTSRDTSSCTLSLSVVCAFVTKGRLQTTMDPAGGSGIMDMWSMWMTTISECAYSFSLTSAFLPHHIYYYANNRSLPSTFLLIPTLYISR